MFKLEIDLGNAAMQTPDDVAGALERVTSELVGGRTEGGIRDLNGNTVGRWSYEAVVYEDDGDGYCEAHGSYDRTLESCPDEEHAGAGA